MKRLSLLIAFATIAIISFSQGVYEWYDSINTALIIGADTVLQPIKSYETPPMAVGGLAWSVTVDARNLNANDATFEVGGNNLPMLGSTRVLKFECFTDDNLPFTLNKTTMVDTVRSMGWTEITYTQSFRDTYYGFDVPMIRLTPNSVSTGYFVWRFKFYKQ